MASLVWYECCGEKCCRDRRSLMGRVCGWPCQANDFGIKAPTMKWRPMQARGPRKGNRVRGVCPVDVESSERPSQIDYSRSVRRMRGNPLAGRNRGFGVAGTGAGTRMRLTALTASGRLLLVDLRSGSFQSGRVGAALVAPAR